MHNFESNYDQASSGNTGWESLGDVEFERRRAERANRRYEAMQKSEEARASLINKAKSLVAVALLAITVVGGATAHGCATHEIMETGHTEGIETINVSSVVLMDGPNMRNDPWVHDGEDGPTTFIMDFGEEGQVAHVPYQGEVYHYHNQHDPNGDWYGFPESEFVDDLYENAFITKNQAERLAEKDDDGVIWVNGNYVRIDEEQAALNYN